jgi:hypothetical protein
MRKNHGDILVSVLVFAAIAVTVTIGLVNWGAALLTSVRTVAQREQALQIAEAGIDYYRWHLAHAPLDFQDGTGVVGPYTHQFTDKDGNVIGSYTLTITPPMTGSTIVTIVSKGALATSTISRSIRVVMGIPSLAQYAMVTNSPVYYGAGDNVSGPIHSNIGVGFWSGSPQPIAHDIVTSAVSTFTDTASNSACPGTHFGVYTCVPTADPNPPAAVPSRPDVFAGGRQFPVPAVDFTSITADLSTIRSQAIASGFYRSSSGVSGYKIVLKTNNTFDLYTVNSLLPAATGCSNSYPGGQTGWGTWSINVISGAEQSTLVGNYPVPPNGLLFFDDNVWVEGTINKSRVTIAAGTFPATGKNIIVNNNLKYTNFDGQDSIGLIAQGNFLVGLSSADNLTIDGALVAQNGGTIRYYYTSSCPGYLRTTLTTYGMFASNGQGYFSYGSSGYASQPASYDPNFLYGPPPSFPLTSSFYNTLSWQEVQ